MTAHGIVFPHTTLGSFTRAPISNLYADATVVQLQQHRHSGASFFHPGDSLGRHDLENSGRASGREWLFVHVIQVIAVDYLQENFQGFPTAHLRGERFPTA